MDQSKLHMINTLTESLAVIEALVYRPDLTYHGDEIMELLKQLHEKREVVQESLEHTSNVYRIYYQWIQKQDDLLTELNSLEERMKYLETNLPEECFQKIAADFCSLTPEPSLRNMMYGNTNGFHESYDRNVSCATLMAKTGAQTVVKKQEIYPSLKHLTTEELEKVPHYLRNRMQIDVIQTFVDTFNMILKKKYSLVKLSRNKVPKTEIPLYLKWKNQDNKETKGYDFITDEDLSQFGPSKLAKRDYTILQILRHCKRLKESKLNGQTYYLLLKSNQ